MSKGGQPLKFKPSPWNVKTRRSGNKSIYLDSPKFDVNLTILKTPSLDTTSVDSDVLTPSTHAKLASSGKKVSLKRVNVKVDDALERSLPLPYEIGMASASQSPCADVSKDSKKRLSFTPSPLTTSIKRSRLDTKTDREKEVVENSEDEEESEEVDVTGYSKDNDSVTNHVNEAGNESMESKANNSNSAWNNSTIKKSYSNMETQIGSSRLTRGRKQKNVSGDVSKLRLKNRDNSTGIPMDDFEKSDIDSDDNQTFFKKPDSIHSVKKKVPVMNATYNKNRSTRSSVKLDQLSLQSFVTNVNSILDDDIQKSIIDMTKKIEESRKITNQPIIKKPRPVIVDRSMNTTHMPKKRKKKQRLVMKNNRKRAGKNKTITVDGKSEPAQHAEEDDTSKLKSKTAADKDREKKHVSFVEPARKSPGKFPGRNYALESDYYKNDSRLIEEEDVDDYEPTGWVGIGGSEDEVAAPKKGTPHPMKRKGLKKKQTSKSPNIIDSGSFIENEGLNREDVSIQYKDIFSNSISRKVLVRSASTEDWEQPRGNNTHLQMCKYFSEPSFSCGQIRIKPFGRKGFQKNKQDKMIFQNLIGQLKVTIYKTTFRCISGDVFQIPEGNMYDIVNEGDTEARLTFFQLKAE